jgi:pimeloyl-ACP methyl ester carboxylesterase
MTDPSGANDPFGAAYILERDGCPIHYWLSGPEGAPWVVLTHGGYVDHTMYAPQMSLLNADCRVLAWDMRGHGASRPLRGPLSYRAAGEDLIALMDAANVERAVLVGHSMGGCAAQEAVRHHPHRVAALALLGCPRVTAALPRATRVFTRLNLIMGRVLGARGLRQQLERQATMFSIVPEVQEYIRQASAVITPETARAISRAVLRGYHHEPAYTISKPLLLAHGDHDLKPIQNEMALWSEREPRCRYVVIPEAGHNANQDNPAAFGEALTAFMCEQFL